MISLHLFGRWTISSRVDHDRESSNSLVSVSCIIPIWCYDDILLSCDWCSYDITSIIPFPLVISYDPYNKEFTREYYDHEQMRANRLRAIEKAKSARHVGVILGTLGRQGSTKIMDNLVRRIEETGRTSTTVFLSEIFPEKLSLFNEHVDAWVQIACPRLSIDWGLAFEKPLLSPYEMSVALESIQWRTEAYPMDFYANDSLGSWTVNNEANRPKRVPPSGRRRRGGKVTVSKGDNTEAGEVEKAERDSCTTKKENCSCTCKENC